MIATVPARPRIAPASLSSEAGSCRVIAQVIRKAKIGVVANRLDDRDQGVRAAAARALGRFGEPARPHVPALAERLRREKIPGVQFALLNALGMLGPIAIDAADAVAWAQTVPHLRDPANAAMEKIR